MAKFKVGDKVVYRGGYKWDLGLKFRTITKELKGGCYRVDDLILDWEEDDLELYKESGEMKELTFKEVIANIKEGEVWESIDKSKRVVEIRYDKMFNTICLSGTEESEFCRNYMTAVGINQKFKLKRKEYSFEEAFKALGEGKEIESVITGAKYIVKQNSLKFSGGILTCNVNLSYHEIKGEWYINE